MNNNAPSDQFVVAINVPHIVRSWGFIGSSLHCGSMAKNPSERVNTLHRCTHTFALHMQSMSLEVGNNKAETGTRASLFVMANELIKLSICYVRELPGKTTCLKMVT